MAYGASPLCKKTRPYGHKTCTISWRMDGWMDWQTPLKPFNKLSWSAELKIRDSYNEFLPSIGEIRTSCKKRRTPIWGHRNHWIMIFFLCIKRGECSTILQGLFQFLHHSIKKLDTIFQQQSIYSIWPLWPWKQVKSITQEICYLSSLGVATK
jgi:hypothetical protein